MTDLRISEVFYSIQGEGPYLGTPSVFIRFGICNLFCGFCDSGWTWNWKEYDYNKEVHVMDDDAVFTEALQYPTNHIVFTGGEPMLQLHTVQDTILDLQDEGYTFEVETNGTIKPTPELISGITQWNISPKTDNSGNSKEKREIPEVLSLFAKAPNAYFKFVVSKEADLEEIDCFISRYSIYKNRVLLMPECIDSKTMLDKSRWLVEYCKTTGYRYTPRMQIMLWENKRGT